MLCCAARHLLRACLRLLRKRKSGVGQEIAFALFNFHSSFQIKQVKRGLIARIKWDFNGKAQIALAGLGLDELYKTHPGSSSMKPNS